MIMYDWLIKKILGVKIVDEYKRAMVGKIFTVISTISFLILVMAIGILSLINARADTVEATVLLILFITMLATGFTIMKFRLDIRDRDDHQLRRLIFTTILLVVFVDLANIWQNGFHLMVVIFMSVFLMIFYPGLTIFINYLRNRNHDIE